jgi:hypothetical protein
MKTNFDLVKDRPVVMDGVDMIMPYKIFPTVKDFVDFLNLTVEEKILDEDEKRYIKNIVRPFRDKVISIRKSQDYDMYEYITVIYQDQNNNTDYIYLPSFKKNTMYTGMLLDKYYTLEDLGIIFKN